MYIVFEGVDGVGKSTQANKFSNFLITYEPGGTKIGQILRDILLKEKVSKRAEIFLFLADRAEHFQKFIKPNLNKNIISDRSLISGIAYALEEENLDLLIDMNKFALECKLPDKIVLFYADEDLLKERLSKRKLDTIEKRGIDYLLKVQNNMEKIIQKLQIPYIKIDASKNEDKIYKTIKGFIND